jgi:hypothetical protein
MRALSNIKRRHAAKAYLAAARRWEALTADDRVGPVGRRELETMSLAATATGRELVITTDSAGRVRLEQIAKVA